MKSLAFFLFIFLVGSSAFAINFTKVRLIRIEGLTLSIHGAEPWKSAGPKSAVIWEKNSADGFAMGRLYKTLRPVKGDKPSDMQVVNDSDLNAAWTYPRPTTAPASSRLYESKLYTGTPSSGIVLNLEGSFVISSPNDPENWWSFAIVWRLPSKLKFWSSINGGTHLTLWPRTTGERAPRR